jgi:hypothetical protein
MIKDAYEKIFSIVFREILYCPTVSLEDAM